MKALQIGSFVVGVMLSALLLTGCVKDDPVSANMEMSPASPSIQFLRLPSLGNGVSMQKRIFTSDSVTVNNGGKLKLEYEEKDSDGKKVFDLKIELKFDKKTVTNDFMASLAMDADYLMSTVDLLFGPHGTDFLEPAKLKVHVKGLDLSGFSDDDEIYLYYDHDGVWERMEGKVKINVKDGELVCTDGLLPHFSRYGFGR